MSVRAYLPSDYSNSVVNAFEDFRSVILNRQAQQIVMAKDAADNDDDERFYAAMTMVSCFEVVLDDIAVAIQREQGR